MLFIAASKALKSTLVCKNRMIENIFDEHRQNQMRKEGEHEGLRKSPEYQKQLVFLRRTILDLLTTLKLCTVAASRWQKFTDDYLFSRYIDDIAEAAMIVQFAIENGALNSARRELRFIIEVAVNIAFVDEVRAQDNFKERIDFYRSGRVKKSNVDHVKELPLRLLSEHKEEFARTVIKAWVNATNYVHLTKRRVDEKLELRARGVELGFESIEMLKEVVDEVHETCSIVVVLAFETIGPSFTGDLLVDNLDGMEEWAFHANGYVALIDAYFDYKHERKHKLTQLLEQRKRRIRYQAELLNNI